MVRNMMESRILIAGLFIFSVLTSLAIGQMGPGMMYGYGPGYGINATNPQAVYWMGPGMMGGYRFGPSSISIADELSKLAYLKKEGAVTQDEYNELKNKLIG